ncbi:DUF7716 domain-containing protein [Bacillus sp. JJ1566]
MINNARQQLQQYSQFELFEAFMYYYKNDAFISTGALTQELAA